MVSAYGAATGEPVWRHRDRARFFEAQAGAGPRGTPTLANGRLYTLGATGILNALDATTGALVWSRNVGSDGGEKVPDWGFASSPLVVEDLLLVPPQVGSSPTTSPTGRSTGVASRAA